MAGTYVRSAESPVATSMTKRETDMYRRHCFGGRPPLECLLSLCLVSTGLVGCGQNSDGTGSHHSVPQAGAGKQADETPETELITHGVPVMVRFYEQAGSVSFDADCRDLLESLLQQYGASGLQEVERLGLAVREEVVRRKLASEEAAFLIPADYESYAVFRGNGFRAEK